MFSRILGNMKSVFKDKFKNNVLVKPLYRKLKNGNKIKPKRLISVDSQFKLNGHGINLKKDVVNHSGEVLRSKNIKSKRIFLCNDCDSYNKVHIYETVHVVNNAKDHRGSERKMLHVSEVRKTISNENVQDKSYKFSKADNNIVVLHKVPCTWLRLFPLPKLPEETICSVILRCIFSQLGLSTFLILWTAVWTFSIHYFEGPYETKISTEFEKQQNQLVIDLATELRQIAPLSPRWKAVIEKRLAEEKLMTLSAVTEGARLRPGHYWDLSGTFLFAVYAMTALGFGAPVPLTVPGRTSALIYAVLAVPIHVYLMWNVSTCTVVHVETFVNALRCRLRDKVHFVVGKGALGNGIESPNCSRTSAILKAPSGVIGRRVMRLICVLGASRSVPLAGLLYYMAGACGFGVLRGHAYMDVVLFPLEFTTYGGLDQVAPHLRILYAFYLEGVMILIACALATLRRHTRPYFHRMADKYRLLAFEQ